MIGKDLWRIMSGCGLAETAELVRLYPMLLS
jgi:hypothetical protein